MRLLSISMLSMLAVGCFIQGTDLRGSYDATLSRRATAACVLPAMSFTETTMKVDTGIVRIEGPKACTLTIEAQDYGLASTSGVVGACDFQPAGMQFQPGGSFNETGLDVIWKSEDGKCQVTDHWDLKKK